MREMAEEATAIADALAFHGCGADLNSRLGSLHPVLHSVLLAACWRSEGLPLRLMPRFRAMAQALVMASCSKVPAGTEGGGGGGEAAPTLSDLPPDVMRRIVSLVPFSSWM